MSLNPKGGLEEHGCGAGGDLEENVVGGFAGAFGELEPRRFAEVRRVVEGEEAYVPAETDREGGGNDAVAPLHLDLCLLRRGRTIEEAAAVGDVVAELEGLLIFLQQLVQVSPSHGPDMLRIGEDRETDRQTRTASVSGN